MVWDGLVLLHLLVPLHLLKFFCPVQVAGAAATAFHLRGRGGNWGSDGAFGFGRRSRCCPVSGDFLLTSIPYLEVICGAGAWSRTRVPAPLCVISKRTVVGGELLAFSREPQE